VAGPAKIRKRFYYVSFCAADNSFATGIALCWDEFNIAGVMGLLTDRKGHPCIVTFFAEISQEQYELLDLAVLQPNRGAPAPVLSLRPAPQPWNEPQNPVDGPQPAI
jgi:hypothetical protein